MTEPIPTTADDVDYDFEANASPAPGTGQRSLVADPHALDPGHLATEDEWARIVADAEAAR